MQLITIQNFFHKNMQVLKKKEFFYRKAFKQRFSKVFPNVGGVWSLFYTLLCTLYTFSHSFPILPNSRLTLSWPGKGRSATSNLKHWILVRNIINFSKGLSDNFKTCPKILKMKRIYFWFGTGLDTFLTIYPLVWQICPSLAIYVILKAWPGLG